MTPTAPFAGAEDSSNLVLKSRAHKKRKRKHTKEENKEDVDDENKYAKRVNEENKDDKKDMQHEYNLMWRTEPFEFDPKIHNPAKFEMIHWDAGQHESGWFHAQKL